MREDKPRNINRLAGLLKPFQDIGTKRENKNAVCILVTSIQVTESALVNAAIKNLAKANLKMGIK